MAVFAWAFTRMFVSFSFSFSFFIHSFITFHFDHCLFFWVWQWRSTFDIKFIIHAITQLLAEPEPSDPLNVEAGKQAQEDKTGFETKAAEWTKMNAQKDCSSCCYEGECEIHSDVPPDEIPKSKIQRIGPEWLFKMNMFYDFSFIVFCFILWINELNELLKWL